MGICHKFGLTFIQYLITLAYKMVLLEIVSRCTFSLFRPFLCSCFLLQNGCCSHRIYLSKYTKVLQPCNRPNFLSKNVNFRLVWERIWRRLATIRFCGTKLIEQKIASLSLSLFLNGPTPAHFSIIFVFSNKHYNSYNK